MAGIVGCSETFFDKYGVRGFSALALYGLISLILDLIGWIF